MVATIVLMPEAFDCSSKAMFAALTNFSLDPELAELRPCFTIF